MNLKTPIDPSKGEVVRVLLFSILLFPACEPKPESAQSDPKLEAQKLRSPPKGTIAKGAARLDSERFRGRDAQGAYITQLPLEVNLTLLKRGAERRQLFCDRCHGTGQQPQLKPEQLKEHSVGHLFDVITHGKGRMTALRRRIPVEDRWAIIAHIKGLSPQAPAGQP